MGVSEAFKQKIKKYPCENIVNGNLLRYKKNVMKIIIDKRIYYENINFERLFILISQKVKLQKHTLISHRTAMTIISKKFRETVIMHWNGKEFQRYDSKKHQ